MAARTSSATAPDRAVAALLESVHLAPRQAHKALTLWPLRREGFAPPCPAAACIPLAEALAEGSAQRLDASAGGPRLENRGARAVLVLPGEVPLDARRSRIPSGSFLLAPGASVPLDWASHHPGQRARGGSLASVLESFHTVEEQLGFVAAIGDEIVGLELVASPVLLRAVFDRLLRAYALEAVDAAFVEDPVDAGDHVARGLRYRAPEAFIRALARAELRRAKSLGLGHELQLAGVGVAGAAVEAGGIAHLTAFVGADLR